MKQYYLLFVVSLIYLSLTAQVTSENAFPNLTFDRPVEIQNTGVPGDDRLFVIEQPGRIQVFDNDPMTTTKTEFLDIRSELYYNSGQELGLLGLAFHPDYQTNGYFYLYYTTRASNFRPIINVERIKVQSGNPNAADLTDRQVLFRFTKNQTSTNHNGGKITFGADGYLYISVGDGGGGGDPNENAQNTNNIFGSILRIDVDVDGSNPVDNNGIAPEGNYELPSDNPLVGQAGIDEIYAWGIRNTWKMNFDRQTNRLWGADVGQGDFEEINLIENGGNYGWCRFEGNSLEDAGAPNIPGAAFPVFEYDHNQGDVSITGGYVYRGSEISSTSPNLFGQYIYADYSSGRIWALEYDPFTGNTNNTFLFRASDNGSNIRISSFGEDINGELYFTRYSSGTNGKIFKLIDGTNNSSANPVNGEGEWCTAPTGTDGIIYALATDETDVYAGGDFSMAGGVLANNVALRTNSGWSALGSGTNGRVNAIAVDQNGDVYIGGNFTQAGGVSALNIAKWNGSNWSALGSGTSGPVAALVVDSQNRLYAAGAFQQAGGTVANNIARWGGSWSTLTDATTSGTGTGNEIRSLAVDENDIIYLGGNFGSAGGSNISRIATWDGSHFQGLNGGTNGFVQAIVVRPDYIYVGGNFDMAGSTTANRTARYNRSSGQWESLENGVSSVVNAMTFFNGNLYVGGSFENALNDTPDPNIIVNNTARWNETTGWEALGLGTDVGAESVVYTLTSRGDDVFIGGNLSYAGSTTNTVDNFACWSEGPCPSIREVSIASISGTFTAAQTVQTSGTVVIDGQAQFEAGQQIILKPGFEVPNGNDFLAMIVPCQIGLEENEVASRSEDPLDQLLAKTSNLSVFPNPFQESTTLSYTLTTNAEVQISLLDISGKVQQIILPNALQVSGKHQVEWQAKDLPKGLYFVQLQVDGRVTTVKVVLE
ncbi:MAG: PQQ-dependent sugar dehydrogenase [Bacteroidota bacterium]